MLKCLCRPFEAKRHSQELEQAKQLFWAHPVDGLVVSAHQIDLGKDDGQVSGEVLYVWDRVSVKNVFEKYKLR